MSSPAIVFPKGQAPEFIRDVKARVAEYFETSRRSTKADWSMWVKTVVLLALVFVPYAAIMSNRLAPVTMLVLAVVMGVGMAGVGFGVSHDALHGAYSANCTVNKWLGFTFDVFGANSYMWNLTHNVIHHTYTNIEGVDEDIDYAPFLRLSPHGRYNRAHRYQHLYAFPTYSIVTLFWVFIKDYKYFLKRKLGPYQNKRHPPSEIAILVATKLAYYGWTIVLPLAILNIHWWQFAIGYFAMHVTAGLILGVVFQLAHVVEGTDYPLPDAAGTMEHTWLVHEMVTTSNFARGNRLITWYVAGLNYQIEHHLFPKICSVHYPAISGIVRTVAAEYSIPYNEQPTLSDAIRSHYRTLRRFGREAVVPQHAPAQQWETAGRGEQSSSGGIPAWAMSNSTTGSAGTARHSAGAFTSPPTSTILEK